MKRFIVTASILTSLVILLLVYPSFNQSIIADQARPSITVAVTNSITLPESIGLTKAYCLTTTSDAILSHYFGKDAVENIYAQDGCVSLRLYYGKNKEGVSIYVIVGVDKKGTDMTSGLICQRTMMCPPYCGDM